MWRNDGKHAKVDASTACEWCEKILEDAHKGIQHLANNEVRILINVQRVLDGHWALIIGSDQIIVGQWMQIISTGQPLIEGNAEKPVGGLDSSRLLRFSAQMR